MTVEVLHTWHVKGEAEGETMGVRESALSGLENPAFQRVGNLYRLRLRVLYTTCC